MAAVVSWWIMIEVMGLLALPFTFRLFGRATAHGYPFAKILFVLFWTYTAWLLSFAIPAPTALYGTLAIFTAAGVAGYATNRGLRAWLAGSGLRSILAHNALWTFGFAFFLFQRSMVPDINGAEKYMDFAFLNSLLHAQSMPPPDPWMSGAVINYYYFGYLMFANLAHVFSQPIQITYNLSVATIGGLAFAQTCAVVYRMTRRWGMAILGGAMSAILGNLDGFQQVLEKGSLRGLDVWRSSRVVGRGDTINEFPFFSTIHGDLHPHFIVLPLGIVFLAALLDERLFPSTASGGAGATDPDDRPLPHWVAFGFVTFLLAAMVGISTWELPLGAVALALLAGRAQPLFPLFSRQRLLLALQVIAAVVACYVLFLPFYLNFHAPPSAPAFRVATSSLGQFLLVFGQFLFPVCLLLAWRTWSHPSSGGESRHLVFAAAGLCIVVAMMAGNAVLPLVALLLAGAISVAYRVDQPEDRSGYLLIAIAMIALMACELVYLKDAYGDRLYRMNTVFKLYFQAWTALAIATPWCIHKLITSADVARGVRAFAIAGVACMVAATACFPIGVTSDRVAWRRQRTLDGNEYLRKSHSEDYAIIEWLRANAARDSVILEASGNPYSYHARFSSNTGLPTIMGWANHEGLWRSHDRIVEKRKSDVQRIYDAASLDAVRPLLKQYGVKYILVGEIETVEHAAGLAKFSALPRVFQSGRASIYEVP